MATGLFGPTHDVLFPNLRDWWCLDPDRMPDVVLAPYAETMRRLYRDDLDDRLLVLLGSFLVENALDDLLRATMPRFERLDENRDFSFSIRTEIARAMGLVPPSVLEAVDAVRKLRNEFAHNIEVDELSKAPKEMQAIRTAVTKLGSPATAQEPDLDCFRNFAQTLVLYLHLYADRVSRAFEFYRSGVGLAYFREACREKFGAKWTEDSIKQYETEMANT